MKVGDRIVAVNGKATTTIADIAQQMANRESGDELRARIVRGRTTTAIMIPLVDGNTANAAQPPTSQLAEATDSPADDSAETIDALPVPAADNVQPVMAAKETEQADPTHTVQDLGIATEESDSLRGVIVTKVRENSAADAAGLRAGDRIVSLGGQLVANRGSMESEVAKHQLGDELRLQFVRDKELIVTDMTLASGDALASNAAPTANEPAKGGGSVIEGIGSMLGGLLGGKAKTDSDKTAQTETPAASKKPPADKKAQPAKSSQRDALALGDEEEGVQQVQYEAELSGPAKKELASDPPSLQKLELPADDAKAIETADQTVEQLRQEVERLRKQLDQLKASQ